MDVPFWVWAVTIGGIILILAADLAIVDHPWSKKSGPKEFGVRQAAWWALFYLLLAVAFGIGVGIVGGPTVAGEYFAGFLTEKSLSVDNLFIFYLIITGFAVPRQYRHEVLLVGIVVALIMRGIFIWIGAAAINQWSEVFYLFAALLIYTAYKILKGQIKGEEAGAFDYTDNVFLRRVRKVIPFTDDYRGGALFVRGEGGVRMATPMLLVILAIGVTDLVFAVDSIPAIFGLTQDAYIVFTANAFALMGLRQLYFLLAGLMDRLSQIGWGLSIIMLFIGVKMFLHALHENGVPVPEIGIGVSLVFITSVMVITIVASLWASKRQRAVAETDESGAATGVGGEDRGEEPR
ncbi:TerC/Alx family metal homeostasis membrane protein [Spiractinospora alimapuensis]|uniref:TerC/Alx family metal homeostasis membrane protein n=1 Tax=Spiractinospora alimapuensis TaxID=2820884 RepID=UPI001F28C0AE|nr:TerC/Alx family metal homeostasis membrane protein [Spiractinospora alimapuensis]QVQ52118.1 TerC/Alx family metal homeostasis membrane protein [Spiractinospora alimapuensis]